MKNAKRIITIILAICLTFSIVPAVSAAEEIKNPAISFNDWDEYVEEMRRKSYGANSDELPEGYDQSVIDAINNNIDNSVPVESGASLEDTMEAISSSSVATKIEEKSESQSQTRNSANTAIAESFTVDPVADPFNMAAGAGDSVSLATGALTYEKTLLSLPGRNGHDLNISVRYNSDNAVIDKSEYETEKVNGTVNFNQFATGWSFGFPYIVTHDFYGDNANAMVYFPDGGSYEIEEKTINNHTEYSLANYRLDDVTVSYSNEKYIFSFADGRMMEFDYEQGNILSYTDKFNNKITYAYAPVESYKNSFWDYIFSFNSVSRNLLALSTITDSVGRQIVFDYIPTRTAFDEYISKITISIKENEDVKTEYATINLGRMDSYNGTIYTLKSITDAENHTTSFNYTEKISNFRKELLFKEYEYKVSGSYILMTDMTLPTGGKIFYSYEKARRSYENTIYDLEGVSIGTVADWREVYKVKSRIDSAGDATYYTYEGDRSGYPRWFISRVDGNINVTGQPIYENEAIYRTTVTKNNISTVHNFNYMHHKISEETYSVNSGYNQIPAYSTGKNYSVVLNGKIYTTEVTDEYIATYVYNKIDGQIYSGYEPYTFKPRYHDISISHVEVKTYGESIFCFIFSANKLEVLKLTPSEEAWESEKEYTFEGAGTSPKYSIKYNAQDNTFMVYCYNGGITGLQCWKYDPQQNDGELLSVDFSLAQSNTAPIEVFASNGGVTYFKSGNYMYECTENEDTLTVTGKQMTISAQKGYTVRCGNTYFVCDGKLCLLDFDGATYATFDNVPITSLQAISEGTDNKLYYTQLVDTDNNGTDDRCALISIDVTDINNSPVIEGYCISGINDYTLLATHGGIYLSNGFMFEMMLDTTAKQTRIRVDYTYNDYGQMLSYKKSVTEGAAISHQGGESYEYVDKQNAILIHTDILGNETVYEYEDSLYYIPTSITQYANELNDAIAVVTTNTLSADKKKILVSETEYSDALYRTTYTYDDNSANNNETFPGNVMSEKTEYKNKKHNQNTTSTLNHITYTYDDRDNFVASQTATGILTNTSAFGNKTTVDITTNFTYNDFGQVLTETNAKGQTTTYQYNKNGWQTRVTYPDNTYVATTYNIGSTNKVTTNYNNEYSTIDYFDSMGRATKQTKKVGSGSEKTIAQYSYYLGRIESVSDGTKADYYVYDNFDRVKRVNHGNPTGTSYYSQVTYDDLNLKSTVTLSNYQTTTTYYDIAGRVIKEELGTSAKSVTTYTYDYMGNVTEIIDPNGNRTTNIYNDRGQLTKVINALLQDTKYTYDAFGNVAMVTTPDESELHYEYDNAGRLLKTTNALGASEHFAYDTLGNLIAQKDRKGQVTNYTYDNMNRPLSKATDNTSTTGNLSTAYTYDTLGNVLTMTDGADVTTYDYTGDGLLSGITTPDGESISYSYNDAGYLTGVTDYSGYTYTYTYGGTGDMTGITQKQNGTTVSSMSMFYNYPGVINGWMINHSTDGATDKFYYYDDKGRVTTIDSGMFDFVGNENYYIQQNYVFDPVGNITQKTTTTDGTTNYTYDALNRVTRETAGTTSTAYSYDANNNITQKVMTPDVGPATIKSYTYDGANRMSKETVTFADDITETTFGYDANGNMLYKLCNNSAEEFAYDAWNRLTEYTSAGGVETTYTYNGDNRRTSKTTGNTTINYYWDRDYISMETVGNVTNTNFVTPMGIVSRTQDEDFTFLIRDAHGDVVETFTNGERDTYSYDAFGNEKTPDTNDDNPLRYCGEYYDTESGLIYLRNRYYDPDLGRFINEDPIQDGLNWYAYCGNNPLMFTDPLGFGPGSREEYIAANEAMSEGGQIFVDCASQAYDDAENSYDASVASGDIMGAESARIAMRAASAMDADIRSLDAEGFVEGKVLPVPIYNQYDTPPHDHTNNLCWATCMAMVISYYLGDNIDRTLLIAIKESGREDIFGYNKARPWPSISSYVSPLLVNTQYARRDEVLSINSIQKLIDDGKPFGVMYGAKIDRKWSGHYTLCVGYVSAPGYDTLVVSNDPSGGVRRIQSYEVFCGEYVGDYIPCRPWAYTVY